MRKKLLAIVLMLIACPAAAQTSGRFVFQPMDGGLLRLDTETGQVSHCLKAGDGIACRSVADDRAALQDEIDRLRRENEDLRQAAGRPDPGSQGKLRLPSEDDIDKAMGLVERMMKRMMRVFRDDGQGEGRL